MRFRSSLFASLCLMLAIQTSGQSKAKSTSKLTSPIKRPALVVGLVVDQMRWDFLHRYSDQYTNDGFRRLMREGFACEQTMINHLPTYTAVGHTGVYTGAYPGMHGIVGNNWYDRQLGRNVYCTEDTSVSGVGTTRDAGKMSPRNMHVNTIADELRLATQFKSRTIGISLKDRGAILPAGHSANAAYWYDDQTGNWISSSYYMNTLPTWVESYNQSKRAEALMQKDWNLLLPTSSYVHSEGDVNAYEGSIPGETGNQFPHKLSTITDKKFAALRYTPHGNTYTLEFARKTIESEKLGKQGNTDLLAVSLSSPDYTGHVFGPNSMEIQDMYLRLDLELANFFRYLDSSYGKGNYLLFLTADHGVSQSPGFLNKYHLPADVVNKKDWLKWLNDTIQSVFQVSKAIVEFENDQIYLQTSLRGNEGNAVAVRSFIVQLLKQQSNISQVFELEKTHEVLLTEDLRRRVNASYHVRRSGDIQVIPIPNVFDGQKTGTTHGAWNPYDAHIPLVWMGWGIRAGKTHRQTHMADIAPTLAALLNIQMPNGCQGQVITEIIP